MSVKTAKTSFVPLDVHHADVVYVFFLSLWNPLITKPLRKTPRRVFLIFFEPPNVVECTFQAWIHVFYYSIFFLFSLGLLRDVYENRELIRKRMHYASVFQESVFILFARTH